MKCGSARIHSLKKHRSRGCAHLIASLVNLGCRPAHYAIERIDANFLPK
jgi:hypothetical protein